MATTTRKWYPGDYKRKELLLDVFISQPRQYIFLILYEVAKTQLTRLRVSQILEKRSYFPYLPYLESLGMHLATDPEYPSDKYLLHIVRLQRIAEKLTGFSIPNAPGTDESKAGIEDAYGELTAELVSYEANLPFSLSENRQLFKEILNH
jgi:hypothetical protein